MTARRPARRARHARASSSRRRPGCGARSREEGSRSSEERAAAGFGAEIAYYLEHHLEGARPRVARATCATAARRRSAGARRCPASSTPPPAGRCWRRSSSSPTPTWCPRSSGAARARPAAGGRQQLGLLAARLARPAGLIDLVDGVVTSADVGVAKPGPRSSSGRSRWRASSPARPCTWATRSRTTWRARARPASGPLLVARDGESARRAWSRCGRSTRSRP